MNTLDIYYCPNRNIHSGHLTNQVLLPRMLHSRRKKRTHFLYYNTCTFVYKVNVNIDMCYFVTKRRDPSDHILRYQNGTCFSELLTETKKIFDSSEKLGDFEILIEYIIAYDLNLTESTIFNRITYNIFILSARNCNPPCFS